LEYHSGPLFNLLAANTASLQQDSGLLILMFILLFLSFVIAGSEVAFFSLSYKDIQVLKTKNYKPFTQNNIRFAQDFGFIIQVVYIIFSKPSGLLVKYTNKIEKKLEQKRAGSSYSMEELDHAIELTTSPNNQANEKSILKGIVKFGNISVKQIMKTRLDVCGVDASISFNDLLAHIKEHNYSRFPIYKEDLDTIAGIIHTKDIIPHISENADYDWKPLIRPAFFVHEQKMIEDLLKEFQSKRIHFAIVVDEFGGTSGIITLEDILEEIVGDIKDEFDEEESMIKKIDEYHYIIEGKSTIIDFCNFIEIATNYFDTVKGESDTVAGLFLELAGAFPSIQQVVKFKQFSFTVLEIQKNRIHKIQLIITPLPTQNIENG